MSFNKKRSLAISLSTSFTVYLVVFVLGSLRGFEYNLSDWYLKSRPTESTDSRIVIVGITEKDLQNLDQDRLDDGTLARVIQNINSHNPRVIGLDLFRNVKTCFTTADTCQSDREELASVLQSTSNLIGISTVTKEANLSHPVLSKAERTGSSEIIEDSDRIARRSYLSITNDAGEDVYSFGLDIALKYLEKEKINVIFEKNKFRLNNVVFSHIGSRKTREGSFTSRFNNQLKNFINWLKVNKFYPSKDTDPNQILLNYRQSNTPFKHLSITQVLNNNFSDTKIRDKIILIGAAFDVSGDIFSVPYLESKRNYIYGVELHAHLVSYLINASLDGRTVINFAPGLAELILVTFLLCESSLFIYWLDKKQQKILNLLIVSGVQIAVILVGSGLSLYFGYLLPSAALVFITIVNLATISTLIHNNRHKEEKYKLEKKVRQKTQALNTALDDLKKITRELVEQETLKFFLASTAFLDHEIKNPLGLILVCSDAVTAHAYSLIEYSENNNLDRDSSAVKETIAEIIENNLGIREEAHRINNLIKLVDTQSYQKQESLSSQNIDELIDKVWSVSWYTFRKMICHELEVKVIQEKSDTLEKINIYPKSLEVALVNLLSNALYSLFQKKQAQKSLSNFQPKIKIKTEKHQNNLVIVIEDNGVGIDKGDHQQIFKEFYSTKENSLGLGLFIAKQIIVDKHHGSIDVESKLGSFTRFTIKLPIDLI